MAQDNKNLNRTKIPNSLNGTGDDPKRTKFNIYWAYSIWISGICFVLIIGYYLYKGVNTSGVETDVESFKEMVMQGDVNEIKVIGNKKIVRVYLYKDSLTSKPGYYHSILKTDQVDDLSKLATPNLFFTISDDKNFEQQMDNFKKENPNLKKYTTKYANEGELFGQIISTLLPILLIGLLFIVLMLKIGRLGGGG